MSAGDRTRKKELRSGFGTAYSDLLQQKLDECIIRGELLENLGIVADIDQYREHILRYGL
jgi:hypothetical protein